MNKKPHIIGINARFLALQYQHSGIGIYTRNLIIKLIEHDQENQYHIVSHVPKEDTSIKDITLPDNVHYHELKEPKAPTASMRKSLWEMRTLPKLFTKLGVDTIHSPYPNLSSFKQAKHIVTVHDVIPWILPEYTPGILSKLYHATSKRKTKKADHIFTVSDFSKGELKKYLSVPEDKITITHNAVDSSYEKPSTQKTKKYSDKAYLVYVGGYDKRKNTQQLIDIYENHIAPEYDVDLILIGNKLHNTRLYEEPTTSADTKKKGEIIHTGFVSEEEKRNLIQDALALLHLSLYEGFNIPLLEAMHAGTPALVSDIAPHREVADDAAIFLDVTDEDAMVQKIKEFLNSKEIQNKLQEKGKQRAKNFSWDKTIQEILSLYNNIRPHRDTDQN